MTMTDDALEAAIHARMMRLIADDAFITETLQSLKPWKDEVPPREDVIKALRDSIVNNEALYRELAK